MAKIFLILVIGTFFQIFPLKCYAGILDNSFGAGGTVFTNVGNYNHGEAFDVKIKSNGKIIVAGEVFNGNNEDFAFAQYASNGNLDFTAVTNFANDRDFGRAVAIQSDGKIVVAGGSYSFATTTDFALARYNPNGLLDQSFGTGGKVVTPLSINGDVIWDIVVQPDDKIVVGGSVVIFVDGIYYSYFALMRYEPNGQIDTSFGTNGKVITSISGNDTVRALRIQSDGKIVAAGFTAVGIGVVRYNPNGSLDVSFSDDGIVTFNGAVAYGLAIQNNGKIIVAGRVENDFILVRFEKNGNLDPTFDGDGFLISRFSNNSAFNLATDVAIQSDKKIIVVGESHTIQDQKDFAVARFTDDGKFDLSFGFGGKYILPLNESQDVSLAVALQENGKIISVGASYQNNGSGFRVVRYNDIESTPFDYEGDGKTDISIFRPAPGEWWYQRSSDGGNRAFQFGNSSDKIVPADFTGDGKTDVAIWRPASGDWFVLRSEDNSFYSFPFGTSGDTPVVGDFDADGKADAGVFRSSNQTWFISKSSGGTIIQQFGAAGDKPVAADYDGDGKADIAIFRVNGANGAEWWINRSSNNSVFAASFGNSTDKAVQGDYTGDGKADIAVWRPSDGNWFILRSEDFSFYAFPFGASEDVPVAGDYDGDGRMDAGVFRPTNSTWFVQRSTAGTLIQQFGVAGDLPVPSAFVP